MQIADAVDMVILNCNNNGYIQKCIQSIRANTQGSYKLIVIDQDSKDSSKEWLIRESGVDHLILNKMNVGVAIGMNQGIRAGQNEWISMINSDIEIRDKIWLDKMWNYTIDRHIGFIEARVILYDWNSGQEMFAGMGFNLIRRKCFNEVGYFDEEFFIGEDLDWYTRLEHSKWRTAYCYDTNICHFRNITMKETLKDKWKALEEKRERLLKHKYREAFLEETLYVHSERRLQKQKELLKNKEGL